MNHNNSPKTGMGEALPKTTPESIMDEAAEYFYDHITPPRLMNWVGRSFECLRDYSKYAGITYLYSEEGKVQEATDGLIHPSITFLPDLLKCGTKEETISFLKDDRLNQWMFNEDETRRILVTILKAISQHPFTKDFNGFAVAEIFKVQTDLFHLSEIMLDYREAVKEQKAAA